MFIVRAFKRIGSFHLNLCNLDVLITHVQYYSLLLVFVVSELTCSILLPILVIVLFPSVLESDFFKSLLLFSNNVVLVIIRIY